MSKKTATRATPARAKNWLFTVHNNIEWDIDKSLYDYLVYQQEIGWDEYKVHGQEGKRHDQCYVEFKKAITIVGIKKACPTLKTAHFDKIWSTPACASLYCKKDFEVLRLNGVDANKLAIQAVDAIVEASKNKNKEEHGIYKVFLPDKPSPTEKIISVAVQGTREEFGTLSVKAGKGQGSRTDLKVIQDDIKAGKSLLEIAEKHTAYFKYHAGIEKFYEMKRARDMNKAIQLPPEIIWFHGGAGQGKSRIARDLFGTEIDYYKYERWDKGWWDQYNGEKDLWLNEIEPTTFDPYMLLELLDWTGIRVPRRGKAPVLCNPTRIIITSMANPQLWFVNPEDLSETDLSKALKRRIKGRTFEVKGFKVIGPNADWFDKKFQLEDYQKIFEQDKLLREKYEAKIPKVKIEYTGFRFADVSPEVGEAIVSEMHQYTMLSENDLTQDGGGAPVGDVSSLGLIEEDYEESEYDEDDEKE